MHIRFTQIPPPARVPFIAQPEVKPLRLKMVDSTASS
jgi:hypothetical protein